MVISDRAITTIHDMYCSNQCKYLRKLCAKIDGEFGPGVNFINILRTLFCQYPFAKELRSQSVTEKICANHFGMKKRKLLMKSTPGVSSINVLRAAFMLASPESAKKTVKLSVFFALLGSARVKAVHRTLAKSTPGGVIKYKPIRARQKNITSLSKLLLYQNC